VDDDVLRGRGDADQLEAGIGDDLVWGGRGRDRVNFLRVTRYSGVGPVTACIRRRLRHLGRRAGNDRVFGDAALTFCMEEAATTN
jgi:Ca2+-binding RTX toxin-like protein